MREITYNLSKKSSEDHLNNISKSLGKPDKGHILWKHKSVVCFKTNERETVCVSLALAKELGYGHFLSLYEYKKVCP